MSMMEYGGFPAMNVTEIIGSARKAAKRLFSDTVGTSAGTTAMYTPYVGATNYVQRKFVNSGRRSKRPRRNARQAHKVLAATTANCILAWKRMINYEKFKCAEKLPNNQSPFEQFNIPIDHSYFGTGTGSNFAPVTQRFPVYFFDLNCIRAENPNGDVSSPTPMYRMIADETGADAGQLRFDPVGGFLPSGQTDTSLTWSTEMDRGQNIGATAPNVGYASILNWSDIRLTLYGATDTETKFTVSLVQFKDNIYNPETGLSLLNSFQRSLRNINYTNMLKSLIFHPLDHGTYDKGRNQWIKVLASKKYIVGPTTSGAETSPAVQSNVGVRFFKRMNRTCNWQWLLQDTTSGTNPAHKIDIEADGLDGPGYDQQLGKDWFSIVHPKARVYLMITATCYNPKNVTTTEVDGVAKDVGGVASGYTGYLQNSAYSTTNTPTFDLLVRNSWSYDY